ncbi:MAG: PaaI family thioesterase [Desulfobacterales bacterium]
MPIATHHAIDPELCGMPNAMEDGFCRVEMTPSDRMKADASGLVHGGFVFGMADYAAMLAVNHPNVVLAKTECRFLKPVRTGERLVAEARVVKSDGKWRMVDVRVSREGDAVFEGAFSCAVLNRHVLDAG